MRKIRIALCLSLISLFGSAASADVINGDFSAGLTGWDHNEGALPSPFPEYPESAFLFGDGLFSSILSQQFDTDGLSMLTFSFYAEVTGEIHETDHFYASILDSSYTSADSLSQSVDPADSGIDPVPAGQSLVSVGDPADAYFFHWSSNPDQTPEMADGAVSMITDEDGWMTISLLLPSGTDTATIRFELIHDYSEDDPMTKIYLDNVTLSDAAVIPAPAAILLAGIGSCLAVAFRRKRPL